MTRPPTSKRRGPALIAIAIATAIGILIGWADTRPAWDDTGVTAGALLLAALVLSWIRPGSAFPIAAALGLPAPLMHAITHRSPGSIFAVALSTAGAAIGHVIGHAMGRARGT